MFDEMFPILSTPDLARSLHFYRDLLGGEVTYQFPPDGEPAYVAVQLGRSKLGIGRQSEPGVLTNDRVTLWVYADDCDAGLDRLRGGGVEVLQEPADQPWGERMATVVDPDGNRVIVASRSSDSTTPRSPSGIAYERRGPAGRLPVLLIHAGIADRRMWDPQWQTLTATRDTVRLDLRGFGASTGRPTGKLDHVADVIDTLHHLGIARCHVVGSSFGAGVAVEVALTRPGLVASLLLGPPGGNLLAERTPDLQNFFDAENAALARNDLDAAVDANVATWVVGPGRTGSDVRPDVTAAVRRMQRTAFENTASWDDIDETELEPPALDRLADLVQPVLVLVGGHDLDTTRDAADRICAGAPHVRRVDWADVAHLPSMEKPEPFLKLLVDWADTHD